MPSCSVRLVLAVAVALVCGASQAREWYEARGARPPAGSKVYICHGYSCRIVTPVRLGQAELVRITAPFRTALGDPAAERDAISEAVQIFEAVIGGRIGTSADLPGMQFGRGRDDQMDCIDEATNTTSLLTILAEQGHLNHHRVMEPQARGFFLDGAYPHATAVLAETASGTKWALDSWPRGNAEPPVLQLLSDWKARRPFPS